MLRAVAERLAFLRAIDAAEANPFLFPIAENIDSVRIQNPNDFPGEGERISSAEETKPSQEGYESHESSMGDLGVLPYAIVPDHIVIRLRKNLFLNSRILTRIAAVLDDLVHVAFSMPVSSFRWSRRMLGEESAAGSVCMERRNTRGVYARSQRLEVFQVEDSG